jgi:DNA-binding transcriptional regulator YiaG
MQEFNGRDFPTLRGPEEYGPEKIRQTRELLDCSQVVFGRLLGVSTQTVRSWEQGRNLPHPVARRLMDEIRRNPDYWRGRLRELVEA